MSIEEDSCTIRLRKILEDYKEDLDDVDDEEESLEIRLRRLIEIFKIDLDDVDDEDEDEPLEYLALLRRTLLSVMKTKTLLSS